MKTNRQATLSHGAFFLAAIGFGKEIPVASEHIAIDPAIYDPAIMMGRGSLARNSPARQSGERKLTQALITCNNYLNARFDGFGCVGRLPAVCYFTVRLTKLSLQKK